MTDWKENLAQRIALGFRPSSVPSLSSNQMNTIIDVFISSGSLDTATSAISDEYVRHAIAVRKTNSITTRLLSDTFSTSEDDDALLQKQVKERLREEVPDINLVRLAALRTSVVISVPVSDDDDAPRFVFSTNFKVVLDAMQAVIGSSSECTVSVTGTCLDINGGLVRTDVEHDLPGPFKPHLLTGEEIERVTHLADELPGKHALCLGSLKVFGRKV